MPTLDPYAIKNAQLSDLFCLNYTNKNVEAMYII